MAYATIQDLEDRMGAISEKDVKTAETLLDDAALYIESACGRINYNCSEWRQAARIVSCNMVQRALASKKNGAFGVSQQTISADIYSQTFNFSNPNGDLFLSSADKRILGIPSSYITTMHPHIGSHGRCCP